jgi:hypothetical protein
MQCPFRRGAFGLHAPQFPEPQWARDFEQTKPSAMIVRALDSGKTSRTSADALEPFVVPGHRLLFCTTPKVASSAWLRLLRRMDGQPGWTDHPNFILGSCTANLTKVKDYSGTEQEAMLTSKRWLRVVVVRDPAERLLSAYLDKVRNGGDTKHQLQKYASDLHVGNSTLLGNLSFPDFTQRVVYNL